MKRTFHIDKSGMPSSWLPSRRMSYTSHVQYVPESNAEPDLMCSCFIIYRSRYTIIAINLLQLLLLSRLNLNFFHNQYFLL